MELNKYTLALDVGGTSIQYAVFEGDNILDETLARKSIDSKGSKDSILEIFHQIVGEGINLATSKDSSLSSIAVAICGPFDYSQGISLMKRDKYNAIYNVSLKDELLTAVGTEIPVSFFHDVRSFLAGQAVLDASLRKGKIFAVTLGTGVGSAFMVDGIIVSEGKGVLSKAIGLQPFRNALLEDFIGCQALLKRYQAYFDHTDEIAQDVKEISKRARENETEAKRLFSDLGELLGEAMTPVVKTFEAERIILGGQISNSFDLFSPALLKKLPEKYAGSIFPANNLSLSALYGAKKLMEVSGT